MNGELKLTPAEVVQVEAALAEEPKVIPELADAIKRVNRRPGEDLLSYIAEVREYLRILGPAAIKNPAALHLYRLVVAAEDMVQWAAQTLDEPEKVDGNQSLHDGYRAASLHILASGEDGLEDANAVLSYDPNDKGRPLSALVEELGL